VTNVTLIKKERFVPAEGAPPSPTPVAEETLRDFPGAREHYATRDALATLEAPPVIIGGELLAAMREQAEEAARGYRDGDDEALVAGWYDEARKSALGAGRPLPRTGVTFVSVPVSEVPRALVSRWAPHLLLAKDEPAAPGPAAHPYPEPAEPVAEDGPVMDYALGAAGLASAQRAAAGIPEPPDDGEPGVEVVPLPGIEPTGTPAGDARAEAYEATRVIPAVSAETEALPAVQEDGARP
jgi:hypothetical protein